MIANILQSVGRCRTVLAQVLTRGGLGIACLMLALLPPARAAAQVSPALPIGKGLASALDAADVQVGIAALSALAEKGDAHEDAFWQNVQQDTLGSQIGALDRFLARAYPPSTKEFDRLASRLPLLAQQIDQLFSAKATAGAPVSYDILRSANSLSPAGQQLLFAMRKTQPGVADLLIEHPERFGAVKDAILAGAVSADPGDQVLAIDFAAAAGKTVPTKLVRNALTSGNPELVRAAAVYISRQSSEDARTFDDLLAPALAQAADEKSWLALLRARLIFDHDAGLEAIKAAGGLKGLRSESERIAALVAAGQATAPDAVIARDREVIFGSGGCNLAAAGVEYVAQRLAGADASTTVGEAVTALGILLNNRRSDCSKPVVAHALDRLAAAPAVRDPATAKKLADALIARPSNVNDRAGEWIAAAPAACRVLRGLVSPLKDAASREARLLLAGLATCLRPENPELASLIALVTTGIGDVNGDTLLPVATALAGQPLTGEQAAAIVRTLAAPGLERQRQLDLAALLASAGRGPETLTIVDRLFNANAAPDALALLRRLMAAGVAPHDVLTTERAKTLVALMGANTARAEVAEILARRPEAVAADDLGEAVLMSELDRSNPLSAADCLDFGLLGPFSSLQPGIRLLVGSPYQRGSHDSAVCAHLLAPWNEPRETLIGLVAGPPDQWLTENGAATAERLGQLSTLWDGVERTPGDRAPYREAYLAILTEASRLAPRLPWVEPGSIDTLRLWQRRGASRFPTISTNFAAELWKRRGILYASVVPAVFLAHALLWILLLTAYRRSAIVQSAIFYNTWIRRTLALGYLDLVLLAIGPVRRLLFAPLQETMLGSFGRASADAAAPDSYYGRSGVVAVGLRGLERAVRRAEADTIAGRFMPDESVVSGLAGWRGRVLLIGPSGRGKTSFLRHHINSPALRRPAVCLTADECAEGVTAALAARLGPIGTDDALVASLVRAGRLDIYVDGLNEVAPAVRAEILNFLAANPSANIFVATQLIGDGLPPLQPYYLLPLSREQMHDFLKGRDPFLDPASPIRGAAFCSAADAFLGSFGSLAAPELDSSVANAGGLRAGFFASLANPMDLQTAADLLARGIEPDPFNMQRQQFEIVDAEYRHRTGRPFPAEVFGKAVLAARVAGTAELDPAAFALEIAVLTANKQILTRAERGANGEAVMSYIFRHDKIRDYYTHFAFLGDDPATRYSYARDERFGGVYDLLARALPAARAEELNQFLHIAAVESQDHRLSDRFVQHLRWRRLLDTEDPAWITTLDPPDIEQALVEFERLSQDRARLDEELLALRASVDKARAIARIVTAPDPVTLLHRVTQSLVALGARERESDKPYARAVELPGYGVLELWGLAAPGAPPASLMAALESLIREVAAPPALLVLNVDADKAPEDRDWAGVLDWAAGLASHGVASTLAPAFYQRLRAAEECGGVTALWLELGRSSTSRVAAN